jgi:hypothetical protein
VVLFDGLAGSAVVSLGCGITERRGAAVDSAAGVQECTGYNSGGMKKRSELQRVASEGNAAGCMVGTWSSSDTRRQQWRHAGTVRTAHLEQCRLDTLSHGAWSEDAGVF